VYCYKFGSSVGNSIYSQAYGINPMFIYCYLFVVDPAAVQNMSWRNRKENEWRIK